jgi:Ca-activated chloride channel family protein
VKKIISILTILLAAASVVSAQSKKYLDEGNKLYKEGKYKKADSSYLKALGKSPNYTPAVFNLGNSKYQQQQFELARQTMMSAAVIAKDKETKAAAYYNIGNTYMKQKKWIDATEAFKKALREKPGDADAQYNLSYCRLKSMGDDTEGSSDNSEQRPPSEFAKKLKERADQLIAQRRYAEALDIMNEGIKKDTTVKMFTQYITRIKDIVEIDK